MIAHALAPVPEVVGRRVDTVEGEFERAVCEAMYRSAEQRRRRWSAGLALGLKHGLRGVLFSWPLYLLGAAALVVPGNLSLMLLLFFLPGLWVAGYILRTGVREDYARYVHRVLLRPGALRHILFPGRV